MSAKKEGVGIVGVGVAACAACCAGPILGFLATFGLGTATGFALFGTIGLLLAVIVGAALYLRRRRKSCQSAQMTVQVEAPKVRASP